MTIDVVNSVPNDDGPHFVGRIQKWPQRWIDWNRTALEWFWQGQEARALRLLEDTVTTLQQHVVELIVTEQHANGGFVSVLSRHSLPSSWNLTPIPLDEMVSPVHHEEEKDTIVGDDDENDKRIDKDEENDYSESTMVDPETTLEWVTPHYGENHFFFAAQALLVSQEDDDEAKEAEETTSTTTECMRETRDSSAARVAILHAILCYNLAVLHHQLGLVQARRQCEVAFRLRQAAKYYSRALQSLSLPRLYHDIHKDSRVNWNSCRFGNAHFDSAVPEAWVRYITMAANNNWGHVASYQGDETRVAYCRQGMHAAIVSSWRQGSLSAVPPPMYGRDEALESLSSTAMDIDEDDFLFFVKSWQHARLYQRRLPPAA